MSVEDNPSQAIGLPFDKSNSDCMALCRLCREGRIFGVQDWIKAGKPIHFVGPHTKHLPIGIAVHQGCHSLAKLLLQNGVPPSEKILWLALRGDGPCYARRIKKYIINLLLEFGADLQHISPWYGMVHSDLIPMMIERGDIVTSAPIFKGLIDGNSVVFRVAKRQLDRPEIKSQFDMALRHAAASYWSSEDRKIVHKLLEVGCDPRLKGPQKPEHKNWEWRWVTALEEGGFEFMKYVGLDPAKDDLTAYMVNAVLRGSHEYIQYVLDRGGDLESAANTLDKNRRKRFRSRMKKFNDAKESPQNKC